MSEVESKTRQMPLPPTPQGESQPVAGFRSKWAVAFNVILAVTLLYSNTRSFSFAPPRLQAQCHAREASDDVASAISKEKSPPGAVHLISYAQGEVFERSGACIAESVRRHNLADTVTLWRYEDITTFIPHEVWNYTPRKIRYVRPACMAHKSRMLMYFLNQEYNSVANTTSQINQGRSIPPLVAEGDWVFWADSSRHYPHGFKAQSNLRQFANILERRGLDAFVGMPCGKNLRSKKALRYGDGLVSLVVFEAMRADVPKYWYAPHYQNSFFGFRNNNRSRAFAQEWWSFNSDMYVACSSHTHDQAIFSLLVTKYGYKSMLSLRTPEALKDPNVVIELLLQNDSQKFYTGEEVHSAVPRLFYPEWRS